MGRLNLSAHDYPYPLIVVGGFAGLVGVVLFLWLTSRALGRLFDRPRVPLGAGTYFMLTVLCAGALAVGGAAFATTRLLRDHARLEGHVRLAELSCEQAAPGHVRISFTPADASAESSDRRERSEPIDSAGATCVVWADLIRLRTLPSRLGVSTLVRVSRVGETERPSHNPEWLSTASTAPPFPLQLIIRDAQTTSVAAAPDPRAVYQVVASPQGLTLEKSPRR